MALAPEALLAGPAAPRRSALSSGHDRRRFQNSLPCKFLAYTYEKDGPFIHGVVELREVFSWGPGPHAAFAEHQRCSLNISHSPEAVVWHVGMVLWGPQLRGHIITPPCRSRAICIQGMS
eukprot:6389036-Pyramimonas_sp.AAC.1